MRIRVLGLVALGVMVGCLAVQADEPAKPKAETACCLKAKAKANSSCETAKGACCKAKAACCEPKSACCETTATASGAKASECETTRVAARGKSPKAGGCCGAKAKVAKAEPKSVTK